LLHLWQTDKLMACHYKGAEQTTMTLLGLQFQSAHVFSNYDSIHPNHKKWQISKKKYDKYSYHNSNKGWFGTIWKKNKLLRNYFGNFSNINGSYKYKNTFNKRTHSIYCTYSVPKHIQIIANPSLRIYNRHLYTQTNNNQNIQTSAHYISSFDPTGACISIKKTTLNTFLQY